MDTAATTASETQMEQIREFIKESCDLPPMPHVAARVSRLAGDPTSSSRHLCRVIEMDQTITAMILRLANSAYYGRSGRVKTLDGAVFVLGSSAIKDLVVALAGKALFTREGGVHEQMLWDHAVGAALASRIIAKEIGFLEVEPAFVGGLLHDIGKAMFNLRFKAEYAPILDRALAGSGSFRELEQAAFGFTHTELGAVLAQEWNLPPQHIAVIRDHHIESECPDAHRVVDIVRAANQLCRRLGVGFRQPDDDAPPEGAWLRRLGLGPERFEEMGGLLQLTLEQEWDLF